MMTQERNGVDVEGFFANLNNRIITSIPKLPVESRLWLLVWLFGSGRLTEDADIGQFMGMDGQTVRSHVDKARRAIAADVFEKAHPETLRYGASRRMFFSCVERVAARMAGPQPRVSHGLWDWIKAAGRSLRREQVRRQAGEEARAGVAAGPSVRHDRDWIKLLRPVAPVAGLAVLLLAIAAAPPGSVTRLFVDSFRLLDSEPAGEAPVVDSEPGGARLEAPVVDSEPGGARLEAPVVDSGPGGARPKAPVWQAVKHKEFERESLQQIEQQFLAQRSLRQRKPEVEGE